MVPKNSDYLDILFSACYNAPQNRFRAQIPVISTNIFLWGIHSQKSNKIQKSFIFSRIFPCIDSHRFIFISKSFYTEKKNGGFIS